LRQDLARIVNFAWVGGVGFCVDASIMKVLYTFYGWSIHEARLVSFCVAVFITWWLNRRSTFKALVAGGQSKTREYVKYYVIQAFGALLNLGLFSALVEVSPFWREWPVLTLGLAACVVMVINFLCLRLFVYKANKHVSV